MVPSSSADNLTSHHARGVNVFAEDDKRVKAARAVHASKIRDTGLAISRANGISRTGNDLNIT